MFRISPSKKDAILAIPTDPVTKWTIDRNFAFPPALTRNDEYHPRFKEIREIPKPGYTLYHQISQYNPWLDCEMTREKRAFLAPRVGEFCCPVYVGGSGGGNGADLGRSVPPNFFRNETVIDIVNLYLWPLLHSRADDVIACRTFAEWRHLFAQTIYLAFPDYEYWGSVAASAGSGAYASTFIPVSDQRRTARILKYITPARVLYLLTTRANLWPYSASTRSSYSPSSRISYGLCSIKPKIKEYTYRTEIDWLVGAEFLRKMKRVHVYFTHTETTGGGGGGGVTLNDSDSDSG
jgi:hypothetical protein